MGANNSTRRVSFESDENENVTVVKGIRLSENVINRMREPSMASRLQPPPPPPPHPPPFEPIPSFPPPPDTIAPPPPPPPPQPEQVVESESSAPKVTPVAPPPPPPPPPVAPAIDEEALKKRISDEVYEGLQKQRVKTEQELQTWLEVEKSRASAQAQAEAKRHVKDEVSRILSAERVMAEENIQQALIRERIATEEEKLRTQLYAKQLAAKEANLSKQEAFYKEQVARLEEMSAQSYKVTTENYHKAADQVNAKFKRNETYPVCADLQGQILACYRENTGKTLHCSNIAAMYLQCVNNAKLENKHAAARIDDIPS
ncbi:coiled-coil-helix-coiled-coil-helix domain containing 3a isoform X3 [Syngnathus typhle]|uniref:coiled-coil-helix-coiled-coil-helix domain containing 3a isoform X3 n=1 Tax=Syngnathus typhle TaxID=161592 RepID=UPI002A6B73FA|nr:coiled-coil-helix-coiled-coil-helix domain containing 3a isoform X3 [Syngnathus typhle]